MTSRSRDVLLASAVRLSLLTVAWNLLAGAAVVVSAFLHSSLSLAGFGLNMLIDTSTSTALVWRFKTEVRDPVAAARVERRTHVGISLAMLGVALFVGTKALIALAGGSHPETSALGLGLTGASLVALPWLAIRKLGVASALPSGALRADAVLTAASAALGAMALAALLANSWLGWWWADPAAALAIASALVFEAGRMRF